MNDSDFPVPIILMIIMLIACMSLAVIYKDSLVDDFDNGKITVETIQNAPHYNDDDYYIVEIWSVLLSGHSYTQFGSITKKDFERWGL